MLPSISRMPARSSRRIAGKNVSSRRRRWIMTPSTAERRQREANAGVSNSTSALGPAKRRDPALTPRTERSKGADPLGRKPRESLYDRLKIALDRPKSERPWLLVCRSPRPVLPYQTRLSMNCRSKIWTPHEALGEGVTDENVFGCASLSILCFTSVR